MEEKSKTKKNPVIGIGASAGGLSAFENFLKNMPSGKDAAIVIIQHLDPNHKSILADIVNRYTEMDVLQITDGVKIEPGKVYIIPPNKDVTLKEGELILSPPIKIQGRHLPVDTFFRSLKEDLQEKAIAVILSGTGSDGTHGIRDIKEAGGLTLVQSPETAQYDGMPRSAIKTGLVDFIIPVEKMPEIILKYIDNEFQEKKIIKTGDEQVDSYINKIFHLVQKQTGHDFRGYKQNTINRRIERRLTVNQVQSLKDYLEILNTKPKEIEMLYKELLISVTNFFRDTNVFNFIEDKLIPKLISELTGDTVRIWIVACATGEEAYSWAILLKKYIEDNKLNLNIQIFASDIDLDAIAKAREGFYNNNIISDVPQELLNKYFIKETDGYRVKKSVRESIIFAEQNVLQDPPYSKLHLISCRNFLIYLDNNLQQKVIATFHYSLNSDGLLVLGNSESLGGLANFFKIVDRKHKIFQKLESTNMLNKIWNITGRHSTTSQDEEKQNKLSIPLNKIAEQIVLERYIPPSVIINENLDIQYIQGKTGKFLELTTGELTHNIIKIAREGLKISLTNAIRKAKINKKETVVKNVRVKTNGEFEYINLTVLPIIKNNKTTDLLLVIFDSYNRLNENLSLKNTASSEVNRVSELEKELAEKEEYLQSTIEELETTNEELKSSNEEAQSANEELQSTNEELETSKEELQSVNEELVTTNAELQNKLEELGKLNSVLNNLLSSTQIATLFLDKDFKIFQFTPAVASIIDLIPSDIGRSIRQFSNNLEYDSLLEDAQKVWNNQEVVETEVKTYSDQYYWMRILPYRTIENSVEGVVITFTDINEKKKNDAEIDSYKNKLEQLVEEKAKELKESQQMLARTEKLANIGSWEWGVDDKSIKWSDELYKIFKLDPQRGTPDYQQRNIRYAPESLKRLENAISDAIKKGITYKLELDIVRTDDEVRHCIAIGHPILNESGRVIKLVGSLQDITERKISENKVQELAEERYRILESINDGFFVINQEFIVEYFNLAAEILLNKKRDSVVGKNLFDAFPEAKGSIFEEEYIKSLKEQRSISFETHFLPHNKWYKVSTYPYGKKISVIFSDVTLQKQSQINLQNALSEKDVLLKEIHHRVKNNMQTISSLLHMQEERVEDDKLKSILNESIQRVKTMAIIHDDIYHSDDLSNVDFSEYINIFCNKLLSTYKTSVNQINVQLSTRVDTIFIPIDKVIPIALVLNELINNSINHAFSYDRNNEIIVDCKKIENEISLSVKDNGTGFKQKIDLKSIKSLGLFLVYNIVTKQLKGKVDLFQENKTEFVIKFDLTGQKYNE